LLRSKKYQRLDNFVCRPLHLDVQSRITERLINEPLDSSKKRPDGRFLYACKKVRSVIRAFRAALPDFALSLPTPRVRSVATDEGGC
jgi:hypothetical protein